jgi:hypothetical protein
MAGRWSGGGGPNACRASAAPPNIAIAPAKARLINFRMVHPKNMS